MEHSRLVIDTDIIIDELRLGRSPLTIALEHFDCDITAITLFELKSAPHLSEKQRSKLDVLLTAMGVLTFDMLCAEHAAVIARSLKALGQPIGLADIFSASICIDSNLPFLTRNIEHFKRVVGLQVVTPDDLGRLIAAHS